MIYEYVLDEIAEDDFNEKIRAFYLEGNDIYVNSELLNRGKGRL